MDPCRTETQEFHCVGFQRLSDSLGNQAEGPKSNLGVARQRQYSHLAADEVACGAAWAELSVQCAVLALVQWN